MVIFGGLGDAVGGTKKDERIQQVDFFGIGNSKTYSPTTNLSYAPTSNYSTQYTDARSYQRTSTYAPVDARSLSVIIDSPNATQVTKKDVSSEPYISPSLTPYIAPSTSQSGSTTDQSGSSNTPDNFGTVLLYSALATLAYGGYRVIKKKTSRRGKK